MPSALIAQLFGRLSGTPDAPLLYQGQRVWTCGEVARRAGAVAQAVGRPKPGEGPRVVAIYGNPSLESVAAVYGVLLAGHAFSCFDHFLTPRKAADCGRTLRPDWVLTGTGSKAEVTDALAAGVAPCRALADLAPAAGPPEPATIDPGQAAYVLFTSGSTGEPKAACVSHEAAWQAQRVYWGVAGLGPGDLIANEVMPSFDVATFDLFGILTGARLVLPESGAIAEDGSAFRRHLAERAASLVFTVPSIAEGLTHSQTVSQLPQLRFLGLTGELVSADLARRLGAALPEARIWNLFGMTEAPYLLESPVASAGPELNSFAVPGGHARLALRTEDGEHPVETAPIGAQGELVIAGTVLFNGYLDASRAALRRRVRSRAAFGDYFAITSQRRLRYLGRRERFAQIWGVRVLLDQIEAVLQEHPAVQRAVVYKSRNGERLVAVLEPADPRSLGALQEVEAHARERLDRYELPASWHWVDAVPLTRTGKKDRAALAVRFGLQTAAQP